MRFGIIGCGVIGPTHARCLSELPEVEIAALCDVIPERAEKLARLYGGRVFDDHRQMLQMDELDVVAICTPPYLHADLGIAVAQAGKHVIVEKPLDISLEKADALIHACRQAGIRLGVISQHRFDPPIVALKEAIDQGKLGQIHFAGAYTQWFRGQEYYDSAAWRGTWAMEGGGALINQSIHYIDLLQFLAGPVETLTAFATNRAHPKIEVEDTCVAALRFCNGALGVIEGMTSAYPGFFTRLEVRGSDGGVVIEDDQVLDWRLRSGEPYPGPSGAGTSIAGTSSHDIWHLGHRRQIEEYVDALRQGRPCRVDGLEGRKPLQIVLAIYESARLGKPVFLT